MKCVLFVLFLLPAVLFSQGSIASSNQSAKEAASGYTVVKNNARGAWDFTRMGKKYLETKDTVLDFSGNGKNAFRSGTTFNPIVMETMVEGWGSITSAACENTNATKKCYVSDGACTNFLNSDFEVHITMSFQDGRIGSQYFYGISNGLTKHFTASISSTGTIKLNINLNGSSFSDFESAYALNDKITGSVYIRIRCDFTNDILKVYVNGIETPMTLLSGNSFDLINPSGFANAYGVGIGGTRTGSTSIQSGNGNLLVYKAAVTGLLTDIQALQAANWFTYLK